MKNFIFKSSDPDLQKMFSIMIAMEKNILYLTYRMDACLKKVNEITTDQGLQKQVDEYFDETSPQTDSDKQDLD